MEWNDSELAYAAALVSRMRSEPGPARTRVVHDIALRVSDAIPLLPGLPIPRNHGSLLVRQLFKSMGLDEERIFQWRVEHKLVQALVLQHCVPGCVPVTRGLEHELRGLTPTEACRRLSALHGADVLIKSSLGEASGEMSQVDQYEAALAACTAGEALHYGDDGDDEAGERFILQERIGIRHEYRVHSFEDAVIPELTFRRYQPEDTLPSERTQPDAFVRAVLEQLPAALVRDTMYGWDVAVDESDRWYVIDANPAGFHPVHKRGFQCSGFLQAPRWAAPVAARLLESVSRQYGIEIDIELDAPEHREVTRAYRRVALSRPYPEQATHQLFERQVKARPDSTAVVSDEETVTYGELNARANRLAHHLRAIGVTHETCVAVYVRPGVSLVVGLLAVMKAGGTYVPLDPMHPPARSRYMLEDAGVRVVLSERALHLDLVTSTAKIVYLDRDSAAYASAPAVDPDWPHALENLAYVTYTSGSTGRPKGVAIQHRALTNVLWSLREEFGAVATDRWLAVSTITFDIAGVELYLPLITGAQVWLAKTGDVGDPLILKRRLALSSANVLQATPSTWQLLIAADWHGGPGFSAHAGGEPLPSGLAQQLSHRAGAVWNLYGPTETTIWSSVCRISGGESSRVSIGEPVANTTLYVLDGEMQAQPPGVIGELYIGGLGLARGYVNAPGLTAQRFVADPFSTEPGARMYRSGDLARWANGQLECLGRVDHQVKIHGVRIELGEIEEALRAHDDVRDAVVVAHEENDRTRRLVAYVVHVRGRSTTNGTLQAFLRSRLPGIMVPRTIVALDDLPRNTNGKIDRSALPAPPPSAPAPASAPSSDHAAPGNTTEEMVKQLWIGVLGLEQVGLDDAFLDLGGNSLRAIQCVNRIRETFDIELPLLTLFEEASTVRTMARLIDESFVEESHQTLH